MNDQEKKIIIATGGTGGHIFPAVSLANYLIKTGFNLTLTTDKRGFKFIDDKLLSNTKTINSTPLDNNKKITSIFKILLAVFKSIIFLIKTKPKLIFGMGGYASFPLCFAGIILRIPFIDLVISASLRDSRAYCDMGLFAIGKSCFGPV